MFGQVKGRQVSAAVRARKSMLVGDRLVLETTYSKKIAIEERDFFETTHLTREIFVRDAYDSPWSRVRPPSGASLHL